MIWKRGKKKFYYSVYIFDKVTEYILRFESTRAVSWEKAENNVRWRNFQDTPADSLVLGGRPVLVRAARSGSKQDQIWMNLFRKQRGLSEISFPERKELSSKPQPPYQPNLPGVFTPRNAQLL